MKLSIVIVNYNVVFYLEQCLKSVEKAITTIDAEIFVVDNNSVDGSCQMVRNNFPNVQLIENKTNVGFSKANNQAISIANAEFILLLNPDTVVEESSFNKILAYMDSHSDVGGLGVKMIDGNGVYLRESKRGFPSPIVSFYKLSGLSKLFPKSKTFNHYHLGFLNADEIHEVEVLSGAFMLLRKSVLETIGLLDESYFMYGEDIDLSYRIIKAGYKNIYFPETTIIHYKGQSTQKGSLNYVILFYTAMKIFAKKFFSKSHARIFLLFINLAINIRGILSILRRLISKIVYPLLDFASLYFGFSIISKYWGIYKYQNPTYTFPDFYYIFNLPMYGLILVFTFYVTGSYLRPISLNKTLKSIFFSIIVIISFFALLPVELRFSRVSFVGGIIWISFTIPAIRYMLQLIDKQDFEIKSKHKRRTIIIGLEDECERVKELLSHSNKNGIIIGNVSKEPTDNPFYIGSLEQLRNIIKIHKIEDVIFCERDIPEHIIINKMIHISSKNIEFKIAPPHSKIIVGNNLSNSISELYTIDINSISLPHNKKIKRYFDIAFSIILLILSPLLFIIWTNQISQLYRNCFNVLNAKKTWVGYNNLPNNTKLNLPKLKTGIISVYEKMDNNIDRITNSNIFYARNYHVLKDLYIVISNFNRIKS